MDSGLITIIGALATAMGGLGGWLAKNGVDAWLKVRADKRVDAKVEDDREDQLAAKEENTLRYIIGEQAGELKSLRSEIKESEKSHRLELAAIHSQHNECEKRHAALETELRVRMEYIKDDLASLRQCQNETNRVVAENRDAGKGDSKVLGVLLPDGTIAKPEHVSRVVAREAAIVAREAAAGMVDGAPPTAGGDSAASTEAFTPAAGDRAGA